MPLGDRTGPAGMGPRTGRGLGFCNGYRIPGSFSRSYPRFGGGFGRGMGRGWGWRGAIHPYPPFASAVPEPDPLNADEEKDMIQNQITDLEKSLDMLKNRLNELSKKK